MIVAGEASGDTHAAKVVAALRAIEPDTAFEFFGAAGPKMRDAGVEAIVEADGLSIVGLAEIAQALPMFLRVSAGLKRAARERKPDAVLLVDFPDFNLKLAKSLKKQGLTVIYYISPQLWAWRKYRLSTVRKYVDLMITILPFEKGWYARRGVTNVEYVGSPLAREVHASRSKDELCREYGFDGSKPLVALLPGSRHKEIVRILPTLLEAADLISARVPGSQFIVPVSTPANRLDAEQIIANKEKPGDDLIRIVENDTYNALNASDAAAVTSGTATLESGIIGTPMVVVYKTSALNYRLLEPMIDVPHYGLINLIAEKRVATELIQGDFTAERLADELASLLEPETNAAMRVKLRSVSDKLGHGGASKRAAEAVLRTMESHARA